MDSHLEALYKKMDIAGDKMLRLEEVIRLATINTESPTWQLLHAVRRAANPQRLNRQRLLETYRQYYAARIEYLEAAKAFEAARCGKPAPAFFDKDIDEARNRLYRTSEIIAKHTS